MIVEILTHGIHNKEKFEKIYHLDGDYYLLTSYFRNEKGISRCQWNIGVSNDNANNFKVISRLGSCEIYNEDSSFEGFKKSSLEYIQRISD